jgi:protocatechuate 3,4-dioxygenase beta subunit
LTYHFQDTTKILASISRQLDNGTSAEKILRDTSLIFLHPNEKFRSLIRKYPVSGELTLVSPNEAGERIRIIAMVKDKKGNPVTNALVFCYQTDDRGFYGMNTNHVAGVEGDRRHARLFGYLITNSQGQFVLNTIHPRGYPNSSLPSHIHCEISGPDSSVRITELLFDEDPRLTPDQRARSLSEGFIIARRNHNQYEYVIVMQQ